ncbi:MAG: hypothetical protein KAU28_06680 [Phycisphaerae bacterium]|nr:hypothetical protein [Phycisphaerae bacterium]
MAKLLKRYLLYLIRWQLSTPILAVCVMVFVASMGPTWTTALANLIGGLLFFWVDQWIFRNTDILYSGELWEAVENVTCADCGRHIERGYRLIKGKNYDRSRDKHPKFRCHECSRKKYEQTRQQLDEQAV